MRARLLFLALLVFVAIVIKPSVAQCAMPDTDCPGCKEIEGAPRAQMFLSLDSENYNLTGTFFYENASDPVNPRPFLANTTIIVEMFNNTFDKTYKIYTDANGRAVLDFSAYAGGCMDFKVMYCPFTCIGSSDCGFQNCLNYSNIPCNAGGVCSATSCTAQTITPAPNAKVPPAVRCYVALPTMDTASYCPSPLPLSSVPTICFPLLLIFTVLGGGLFLSGKNPFGGFDFTAPRVGKHIRYEAKGRGAGISAGVLETYAKGITTDLTGKALTAGVKKLAGLTQGKKGEKIVTAAIDTSQNIKAAQQQAQQAKQGKDAGGKVQLVGGGKVAGGGARSLREVLRGQTISPGSRFSAIGQLAGLVGYGAAAAYHAARGDMAGAKKSIMKSSIVAQAVGGVKQAGANLRSIGQLTPNDSARASSLLQAAQLAAGSASLANEVAAKLGAAVSQSIEVKRGEAGQGKPPVVILSTKKTIEIEDRKKVNKVVVEMTVGGKKVLVTLDEASLRMGSINGRITIGDKTATVEEGKIKSVWTELGGKDRAAVLGRVDMKEVMALVGTEAFQFGLRDPTNIIMDQATVSLANGQKITILGTPEEVASGKFTIVLASDSKAPPGVDTVVNIDGGKIASVGTTIAAPWLLQGATAPGKEFAAAAKEFNMDAVTGALATAITVESRFNAQEYGGAVTVVTNPLGPTDTYQVIRPGEGGNDTNNGVVFQVTNGRITDIIDRNESETSRERHPTVDSVTGIKLGSDEVGHVADNVKMLGAAVVERQAELQAVAANSSALADEFHATRVASALEGVEGVSDKLKQELRNNPEVVGAIFQKAEAAAVSAAASTSATPGTTTYMAAYTTEMKKQFSSELTELGGERISPSVANAVVAAVATERAPEQRETNLRQVAAWAEAAATNPVITGQANVDTLKYVMDNLSLPPGVKPPEAGGGTAPAVPRMAGGGGGGPGSEPPPKPEHEAAETHVAPSEPVRVEREQETEAAKPVTRGKKKKPTGEDES